MKFIDVEGVTFACPVAFQGVVTFPDPPEGISLDDLVDLTGTGTATFADLVSTDDVTVGDDLTVVGKATVGETLAVTGATTLAALACTTLAASSNATVGGTLGVTGVTTLAACSSTTLTASASLVVTGATVVGLHEHITVNVASLVADGGEGSAEGGLYGFACPIAGTITSIRTRLKGALATGDATLTGKIGGVAITNGVVTITQAASAAGDIDSATPTAANTVAVGSNVEFLVGGTNTAGSGATITVTIRRSA